MAAEVEIAKEIKAQCLKLLVRREHSHNELINKLTAKGYQKEIVDDVVCQLAQEGLQNDHRFAENYVRQRIRKGYGPVRIQYELQQKGVEDFYLNAIVEETVGSWFELLKDVYLRKYGKDKLLDRTDWAKRSRFLQQRGFSGEMIMNLFKQLAIRFD